MRNFGPRVFFALFLFFLVAIIALACGSSPPVEAACSSAPAVSNDNDPQSVSICPAAVDAKNFPGGMVQFVAIGDFTTGPSPAVVKPVIWGVCQDDGPTTEITVSNNGLAQCASGASGTFNVWATGGPDTCLVVGACNACGPTGKAQLTCP